MNFNIERFYETLPVMGKGMLGIFIVTGVIILSIYLLNKLSKGKKSTQTDDDQQ